MGRNDPQVKTKCFVDFLLQHGCTFKRIKASHHHYKCPNCKRTITIQGNEKEVPAFHIRTNLKTMGIAIEDFYARVAENC